MFVWHGGCCCCRELSPAGIEEYSVQIQLRFCLLETTCEQKDEFPPSICVRVNNKIAPLPVRVVCRCRYVR